MKKVIILFFLMSIMSYGAWFKREEKDDFGDIIYYTAIGVSDTNDVAVLIIEEGSIGIYLKSFFELKTDIAFKFDDGTKYYLKFKRQSHDIIYTKNWDLYNKMKSSRYVDIALSDTVTKKVVRVDNTGSSKVINEVINFNQ